MVHPWIFSTVKISCPTVPTSFSWPAPRFDFICQTSGLTSGAGYVRWEFKCHYCVMLLNCYKHVCWKFKLMLHAGSKEHSILSIYWLMPHLHPHTNAICMCKIYINHAHKVFEGLVWLVIGSTLFFLIEISKAAMYWIYLFFFFSFFLTKSSFHYQKAAVLNNLIYLYYVCQS